MFIQNKGFTGDYFKATGERIEKITNVQSDFNEISERLFGIADINKFICILEDELFFEVIPKSASEKLFNAIKLGNLTQNEFQEEYTYSATDGFIGFCTMLQVL